MRISDWSADVCSSDLHKPDSDHMAANPTEIEALVQNRKYAAGFVTDIESVSVPPGLSEDVVRLISAKKGEPEWLLEFRLKAYRRWLTMRSEEHTSELQSLMRISYAVFCLKKKRQKKQNS